ncbi:hypothetical protein [Belnapia rosea]|uniref:hypothetical protein n=1 Tax=Belnapia rosea TaxID=938405 RepID=UPI00088EB323|nr:hypothetical protein [Belnapia rosea]SDB68111.1 hypothetical protein SAMN02927895_03127 [Belnapia rosea]
MGAGAGQRQEARGREGNAGLPPVVVVHALAEAMAALALAGPGGVLLLSAPGAAGSLGAAAFQAMVAAATEAAPGVPCRAALDCGDAPGQALAALRAGLRLLVLDPRCPAFPAVRAAAAECGAELWPERPPAFDCGPVDLTKRSGRNKLALWLRGPG